MYLLPSHPFVHGDKVCSTCYRSPDLPSKWKAKSFPETDLFQYGIVTNKSAHTTTTSGLLIKVIFPNTYIIPAECMQSTNPVRIYHRTIQVCYTSHAEAFQTLCHCFMRSCNSPLTKQFNVICIGIAEILTLFEMMCTVRSLVYLCYQPRK
jgi:hypothetical protein